MKSNELLFNGMPSVLKNHRYPGFNIVWAGGSGSEWGEGYCYGSEDGRIWFSDSNQEFKTSAGNPINGVAFAGNLMAASTPGEIMFWKGPATQGSFVPMLRYPGGAHDVVATATGNLVAPLGTEGLLVARPEQGSVCHCVRLSIENPDIIFYKAACVGTSEGRDVLLCALRQHGWARHLGGDAGFETHQEPNCDIVDVWPIPSPRFPRAAVTLAHDNTLYIIPDVVTSDQMARIKLATFEGDAFEVFGTCDQLFVLTSEALYQLGDLARRWLEGRRVDVTTTFRMFAMEAVCASVARDQSLLVVGPDGGVTEVLLDDLQKVRNRDTFVEFQPTLECLELTLSTLGMVAA